MITLPSTVMINIAPKPLIDEGSSWADDFGSHNYDAYRIQLCEPVYTLIALHDTSPYKDD